MRKTEGGRVPPRPHLIQGNIVTLHPENRKTGTALFGATSPVFWVRGAKHVVTRKSETVFECFSFMGPSGARSKFN